MPMESCTEKKGIRTQKLTQTDEGEICSVIHHADIPATDKANDQVNEDGYYSKDML